MHVHGEGNSPEDIIDAAVKANISLVAITDHNNFRCVKPVQQAASRRSNKPFTILPRIEITLHEGAHLITIFDQSFDENQQRSFLGAIGLKWKSTEKDAVKDRTCSEVLKEIYDRNGTTLVPHPFTRAIGLLDSARKMPTRMAWLESGYLGLIQIPPDKVKYIGYDESGKWQNRYVLRTTPTNVIESTDYSLAPLAPGEAKKPDDIESGAIWLKMGSPNVAGLKQVTCEPRTRISLTYPPPEKENRLLGLSVSRGYFDTLRIPISSDLTCILGENHSGKSAVFDFISFALCRESILGQGREIEKETLLRRLNVILQSTSSVNLFLLRSGTPYCIKRTFNPEFDRSANIIGIEENPEIFRYDLAKDELIPESFDTPPFLPETYPQGHVGLLRKSAETQLALIDELAGLTVERSQRDQIREELKDNAEELSALYETQEDQTGKVGRLEALKQELIELEKPLKETNHEIWEYTSQLIEKFRSKLSVVVESLTGDDYAHVVSRQQVPELEFEKGKVTQADILNSLAKAALEFNKKIRVLYDQLKTAANELDRVVSEPLEKWDREYIEHRQTLSRQLREKGFESPEQHLKRIKDIKREIIQITEIHKPALEVTQKTIARKESERKTLLSQYRDACDAVTSKRLKTMQSLDARIGPDIRVKFGDPDISKYADFLEKLSDEVSSKDHKISHREEQLFLIALSTTPRQLAEAVANHGRFRKDDKTETILQEHCGITANTQSVICRLVDKILALHELQVFELDPIPKIMVRRERTEKFADLLTGLSPGEQSFAILAIALMAREIPLLIDQPEDELGYNYIVNKIVPKILEAKSTRQMIMITHNANIPVLGDAEWLIKVRNDPIEGQPRCSVECIGTFEEKEITKALLDLEGGERAFLTRQYRYAMPRYI